MRKYILLLIGLIIFASCDKGEDLYTFDNAPNSYWILLSEVLTENNGELISESEFIDYAETLNLELIESKYSTQHFKVKEIETGFEALEIANQIYESGKVQYSHPNFIAKIELY